jgi:hypothetical protein
MWKNKLVFALTFSIFIGISLSGSPGSVFAQEIPPNNSNTSGIMNNTTGMIDDAFDALKDSFGTFFGGN